MQIVSIQYVGEMNALTIFSFFSMYEVLKQPTPGHIVIAAIFIDYLYLKLNLAL